MSSSYEAPALSDETLSLLGDVWERLPPAFDAAGAAVGMSAEAAADSVGLLLQRIPERWSYDVTPPNSVTFATTGGDGVHYGVLTDAARPGPVVMTVPMNFDRENLIVGEDIGDFMALGCYFGYFALEQLVYDFEQTARDIEAASAEQQSHEKAVVLATLRERLDLRTPTRVRAHLNDLQERFGHHLARR